MNSNHRTCWRSAAGRLLFVAAAGIAALTASTAAPAQDYPNRAVKIIVPFPAGGTADAMPRAVADFLSRKWGQPVVIENRSGAGGNVGAEAAYKSEPDGYTLLSAPPPPLVVNHNLYPKLGFDPLKFEPIAVMGLVPNALLTNPGFPPKSVADVIAYAKANPGKIISATQGNGTTSHLTSEMFQMMAGIKVTHVPYRGAAPALTDLLAGVVQLKYDTYATSSQLLAAGKLKVLATAGRKRLAQLPNLPTIAESGFPGYEGYLWIGALAPRGTPPEAVRALSAALAKGVQSPAVMERVRADGVEIGASSPEAFGKLIDEELRFWAKLVSEAGITAAD